MRNFFWIIITIILSPILYIRCFLGRSSEERNLKILVIDLGKIGDIVCTTPIFHELKKKFPNSCIEAAIMELSCGVLKNNPHVNGFVFLDSKTYQGFKGGIRLIKELSKKRFDISINLTPYAHTTILPFWAGVPKRITCTSKSTGKTASILSIFNSNRLEYKQHTLKLRHNLELLKFLGVDKADTKKEIFIKNEEREKIKSFLMKNGFKEEDFLIGISVTARNKLKEWASEKFGQLADKLIENTNAKIIFTGAKDDKNAIEKAIANMKYGVVVSTNFNLQELAALLEKFKIFISVDTGPLYIAHALGVPVVNITGPVDIAEQPPRDRISEIVNKDIDCVPCSFLFPCARECKRGDLKCLKETTVEDVFLAVVKTIKRIYA